MVKHHQTNIDDLTNQHSQEQKILQDRVAETEKRFLDAQKQLINELETLRRDYQTLKSSVGGDKPQKPRDEQISSLQAEIASLLERLKDTQMEKLAIVERLKVVCYM